MRQEYIRTLKSLIADFVRDKQPEDVDYYQEVWNWLDSFPTESKLRDKESWVSKIKRGEDCTDIILEEKINCLKEIRQVKDRYSPIVEAAQALVDAVERYVRQECLRSELLNKTKALKALINETER